MRVFIFIKHILTKVLSLSQNDCMITISLLYIATEHKLNSVTGILKVSGSVKNNKLPSKGRLSKLLQNFFRNL